MGQDARRRIAKAEHLAVLDLHALAKDIARDALIFLSQMPFFRRRD